MKNLILITLLILTFITGDSYSQSYFGKSLFQDRIQANNVLYVTSLAQGTNEHATIASALSAYQPGMVIILAPEYFDEDVTISIDNVHIQGLNKELSKIKSLTVTGGYARLENFTVNGIATFTSQKTFAGAWNGTNKTILNGLIFLSNVNLGTAGTTLKEVVELRECDIIGNRKITFNIPTTSEMQWYDVRISPTNASVDERASLYLLGGKLLIQQCRAIYLDSIVYVNSANYTQLSFYRCSPLFITLMATVTSTAFHILSFDYCRFDWGEYQVAGSFTFNGLFELDIVQSTPALWKNIVFNSTANSRIIGMQQRGWQSTSQISGTGLNKLRIYNSSLSGTTPVGLADDRGNVWSAFMDD